MSCVLSRICIPNSIPWFYKYSTNKSEFLALTNCYIYRPSLAESQRT